MSKIDEIPKLNNPEYYKAWSEISGLKFPICFTINSE
jgi:hypothetical protein